MVSLGKKKHTNLFSSANRFFKDLFTFILYLQVFFSGACIKVSYMYTVFVKTRMESEILWNWSNRCL